MMTWQALGYRRGMLLLLVFVSIRPTPESPRSNTRVPYPQLFRATDVGAQRCEARQLLPWFSAPRRSRFPPQWRRPPPTPPTRPPVPSRSEEHTSELQSLMRISYAVFCLKKKTHRQTIHTLTTCTYIHTETNMTVSIYDKERS